MSDKSLAAKLRKWAAGILNRPVCYDYCCNDRVAEVLAILEAEKGPERPTGTRREFMARQGWVIDEDPETWDGKGDMVNDRLLPGKRLVTWMGRREHDVMVYLDTGEPVEAGK